MVAYSFKKHFAPKIIDGSKPQTIRATRTGKVPHVRPGQALQLYTGMRTKQCRKIGDAVCLSVEPIRISFTPKLSPQIMVQGPIRRLYEGDQLEEFARRDGFEGWLDMVAFWRKEHGGDLVTFDGVLITWHKFTPAPPKK